MVECFQNNCLCKSDYFKSGQKFLPENKQGAVSVFAPAKGVSLKENVIEEEDDTETVESEKESYFAKGVVNVEFTILPNNVCCLNYDFAIESNFDEY